jgi:hypothetical protein
VREREDAHRTREAGHLDEIQAVVAKTLKRAQVFLITDNSRVSALASSIG